jgi:hypothetical protein
MLRRDGGHVASKETAGFVQALTEIGLKIKLLGACLLRLICPSSQVLITLLLRVSRSIRGNGGDTEWSRGRATTFQYGLFLRGLVADLDLLLRVMFIYYLD